MEGKQFENVAPGEKDPFEMLEVEWRNAMMAASDDEVNDKIAESAKLVVENQIVLKTDEKILKAKEAVKELTEVARSDIKYGKKRIEFLTDVLRKRGKL